MGRGRETFGWVSTYQDPSVSGGDKTGRQERQKETPKSDQINNNLLVNGHGRNLRSEEDMAGRSDIGGGRSTSCVKLKTTGWDCSGSFRGKNSSY